MNDMRNTNAIQQDLCQGFNDINTNMNKGFDSIAAQMNQLGYMQQNCCCEVKGAINDVRAENYKNTCEITNAIHAEGESTRALINANVLQELRDRLAQRDRDLLTANFHLASRLRVQILLIHFVHSLSQRMSLALLMKALLTKAALTQILAVDFD